MHPVSAGAGTAIAVITPPTTVAAVLTPAGVVHTGSTMITTGLE